MAPYGRKGDLATRSISYVYIPSPIFFNFESLYRKFNNQLNDEGVKSASAEGLLFGANCGRVVAIERDIAIARLRSFESGVNIFMNTNELPESVRKVIETQPLQKTATGEQVPELHADLAAETRVFVLTPVTVTTQPTH